MLIRCRSLAALIAAAAAFALPFNPNDLLLSPPDEPAEPADCAAAREAAERWLAELEPLIGADVKGSARTSVDGRPPGQSAALAWDQFGVMALLAGDAEVAAWAGLHAVALEWQPAYLSNAGVHLIQLDRSADALVLLRCAHGQGFRTPFLLEALAEASRSTGDTAGARSYIGEAAALAPDDVPIQQGNAVINTGQPPPPPPPPVDELDQALRELKAHHERVYLIEKSVLSDLDRLHEETEIRRADLAEEFKIIREDYLTAVEEQIREARKSKADYLRDQGLPANTPDESFALWRQLMTNGALQLMIGGYFMASENLIETAGFWHDQEAYLWANCTGLDPAVFMRAQKLHDDDQPSVRDVAGQQYYRDYYDLGDEATRRWRDERDACGPMDEACRTRADYRLCQTKRMLLDRLQNLVESRYNVAALRFDREATALLQWGEGWANDAYAYGVRWAGKMHFAAPDPAAGGFDMAKVTTDMLTNQFQSTVLTAIWEPDGISIVDFLTEQAEWYRRQREWTLAGLAGLREQVDLECEPIEEKMLELLREEAWQAYLEMLRERMRSDFTVQWDPNFDCEVTLGPASINLQGTAGLSGSAGNVGASVDSTGSGDISGKWKFKNIPFNAKLKMKQGAFAGATLSSSTTQHYGPFAGNAGATLFTENSTATGRLEFGLKANAKLGIGAGIGPAGVACWPGEVQVNFQARAFVEHSMDYARAVSEGRPN